MRLCKARKYLIIDLDKMSALMVVTKTDVSKPYQVKIILDGHELTVASFATVEERKEFLDDLIKAWNNDEARVADSAAFAY